MRPLRCFSIGLQRRLRAVEDAGEVRGQDVVPLLRLHAQEEVVAGDAGVVDEVVDAALRVQDRRRARRPPTRGRPRRGSRRTRVPPAFAISPTASASFASSRAPRNTVAPAAASSRAMARPIPREAPVTSDDLAVERSCRHARLRERGRRWPRATRGPRRSGRAAPLSIFLTRPERTVPGPTSTNGVHALGAPGASTDSCQRTGADTWRTRPSRQSSAVRTTPRVHVVDEGHGGVAEGEGGQVARPAAAGPAS